MSFGSLSSSLGSHAPRLGIGIIGAGRVGPVVAAAWRSAGHQIVGISVTDERSADRAEAILPGVPHMTTADVLERSEAVVFALDAATIKEEVASAAAAQRFQMGQLVIHTSPALGIDVLTPAAEAGAIPLAIHPLLRFTGTSMDVTALNGARAAVSAPKLMVPVALALAVELGCEPFVLDEDDRDLYAAAVAVATEPVSASVAYAWDALSSVGVDDPSAALGPLVRSSVDAAIASGSGAGVGFARGLTPEAVESARRGWSGPDAPVGAHGFYVAMATAAITRAVGRGEISDSHAAAVLDALRRG